MFLQHYSNGLRCAEGRAALVAALGVGDARILELICKTDVIHPPYRLASRGAQHAGERECAELGEARASGGREGINTGSRGR